MEPKSKSTILLASLAASIGAFDPFVVHGTDRTGINFDGDIKLHKEGKPNSRPEAVRAHHKDVRRKNRSRKNKRGY